MKRQIKRIIALAVVALLAVCQILPISAVSTEAPAIAVGSVKAAPGESAEVNISLKNNPGIVAMTLKMSFDTSLLTLKEVRDAGVLGATSHKPELQSPYTLVWVNDTATENFTANGNIVTLVFDVSEGAVIGTEIPITVTYDADNWGIYNKDPKMVDFAIENSSVTVSESGANEISDFDYTLLDADMIITGYKGTKKDVVIGSRYTVGTTEYTVTEIDIEAFCENTDITSVVLPDTLKVIGEAAFYGCTSLTAMTLPKSLESVGADAFYDCTSLLKMTVCSKTVSIADYSIGYYAVRRDDVVVEGFVLEGYAGSTAETYAEGNEGITFVALTEQEQTVDIEYKDFVFEYNATTKWNPEKHEIEAVSGEWVRKEGEITVKNGYNSSLDITFALRLDGIMGVTAIFKENGTVLADNTLILDGCTDTAEPPSAVVTLDLEGMTNKFTNGKLGEVVITVKVN